MNNIEQQLRQENSEYLQDKIRTNSYREDVASLARQILIERNATIPVPETELEAEEKVKLSMRLSTQAFFTVAVWLVVILIFQPTFIKAFLFGLALLSTLAYLRSQRKK